MQYFIHNSTSQASLEIARSAPIYICIPLYLSPLISQDYRAVVVVAAAAVPVIIVTVTYK
jgi:hypothetical protein